MSFALLGACRNTGVIALVLILAWKNTGDSRNAFKWFPSSHLKYIWETAGK